MNSGICLQIHSKDKKMLCYNFLLPFLLLVYLILSEARSVSFMVISWAELLILNSGCGVYWVSAQIQIELRDIETY